MKRWLSPLLHLTGAYARHWRKPEYQQCGLIVEYHRIAPTGHPRSAPGYGVEAGLAVDLFEAQLRFLLKHFRPVRAVNLATREAPLGGPAFAVTFDDGYADNLTLAAPVLKRLGISATVFVTTDFIGSDRLFWWEQLGVMLRETRADRLDVEDVVPDLRHCYEMPPSFSLSSERERQSCHWFVSAALMRTPPREIDATLRAIATGLGVSLRCEGREFPLLDWEQVRELRRSGFDIGAHGTTHANLGLSADAEREIVESVDRVAAETGTAPLTFAYPYGRAEHRSEETRRALEKAGCVAAFTTELGAARPDSDVWALPRVGFTRSWPFAWAYQADRAFRQTP